MNMKRMRGRNHRPNGGGGGGGGFRNQQNGIPLNRNHVFDSSGPEMRVRGTAQQLFEKYTQMARDASSNGDRVTGEAYYQHAEHYFRIISAINQAQGQPAGQPQAGQGERPAYQGNGEQRPYNNQNQGNGEYRNRESGQQDEAPREEFRQSESRQNEPRQERRFEPRQDRQFERGFERKTEFTPRPARTENGFRNEPPVDHRIDISTALEAELAAAAQPAGYGEQPALPIAEPAEARAIPIIPDAPPPATAAEAPVRTPRPRGRPRLVKEAPAEEG